MAVCKGGNIETVSVWPTRLTADCRGLNYLGAHRHIKTKINIFLLEINLKKKNQTIVCVIRVNNSVCLQISIEVI